MFAHPIWKRLAAAPHRAAFLPGLLAAIALLAIWSSEMLLRLSGHSLPFGVAPMQAHAAFMLYGLFPFFMTGFLLTAAPRWLNAPNPARWRVISIPLLLLLALLAAIGGMSGERHWWLLANISWLLALSLLTHTLWLLLKHGQNSDKLHGQAVFVSLLAAIAGLLAMGGWLLGNNSTLWWLMRNLALWGFLLPVFLTVSHRMLPFFSQSVLQPYQAWRPRWLLFALLGGCWLSGLLSFAMLPLWPIALSMSALCSYCLYRWQSWRSLSIRLLAMLHIAFAWLPVGFALLALASLGWLSPLAGLHAITVGFFFSMLVGFASRVMLGHSGRPLQAGNLLWALYWLVQTIALLRVLADLIPGLANSGHLLAAGLLLLACIIWAVFGLPLLTRPRADGKPD